MERDILSTIQALKQKEPKKAFKDFIGCKISHIGKYGEQSGPYFDQTCLEDLVLDRGAFGEIFNPKTPNFS